MPNFPRPAKLRRQQRKLKMLLIFAYDISGVLTSQRTETVKTVIGMYYKGYIQKVLQPAIRRKRPELLTAVQSSYMIMLRHIFRRWWRTTRALQLRNVALFSLFSRPQSMWLWPFSKIEGKHARVKFEDLRGTRRAGSDVCLATGRQCRVAAETVGLTLSLP